jgi:hypothetical protein
MSEIIRTYGLGLAGARDALARTIETGDKGRARRLTNGGEPELAGLAQRHVADPRRWRATASA